MDVGAIEFLTQLRQNGKESLHEVIDTILDNLYHIPDGPEMHTTDCIVYVQQPDSGKVKAAVFTLLLRYPLLLRVL